MSSPRSTLRRVAFTRAHRARILALALALCLGTTSTATADGPEREPSYCTKIRARAHSDAALLWAPSLRAEGLRAPAALGTGPLIDDTYQVRVGLSWSPIDLLRGFRVVDVGDAECERKRAETAGRQISLASVEPFFADAYRAQLRFLEESEPERERLLEAATQRFDEQLITVFELVEYRELDRSLARKQAQVRASLASLIDKGFEHAPDSVLALADRHVTLAARQAEAIGELRSLDP